ncbi:hypothetical protein KC19_3G081500 [Ceratodon purpureus]|uniref:Uncharacterized protein n=1 Tax=Ceratodon purpureus TaxID=3225 RepID=A0A8T0IJW3_CERPU|nr:hypothetical protein KC19_3G081500 [Ceratodon purpureus]
MNDEAIFLHACQSFPILQRENKKTKHTQVPQQNYQTCSCNSTTRIPPPSLRPYSNELQDYTAEIIITTGNVHTLKLISFSALNDIPTIDKRSKKVLQHYHLDNRLLQRSDKFLNPVTLQSMRMKILQGRSCNFFLLRKCILLWANSAKKFRMAVKCILLRMNAVDLVRKSKLNTRKLHTIFT